ncbi:MAG TPA: ElyC/SanA/YdcF family protein [Syntrophorhabdaceae bacterium]|nr:ElyC/SanA/YdcF family protein [Syntrophorhabdaceae bacterium]
MKRYTILIILCAVVGFMACAPYYLLRSDKPGQSDVIVLFLGSRFALRKQEAFKLIADGYSRRLIIPAYGKVSEAGLFSEEWGQTNLRPELATVKGRIANRLSYPKYYEDTHIEILEAKKAMDKAGLTSAIFVSSPYHMRRISIMAAKVFGNHRYRLTFVPSRYEEDDSASWFLHKRDLKFVFSEYSKIGWFMLYRYFT